LIEADQKLNTDRRLADAFAKAGNVALPMLFVLGEPRGRPDKELPDFVKKNAVKLAGAADAPPYPALGVDAGVIEQLGKVATAIGHLNVTPDVDGAIRTEPLVLSYFDQAYPSLSLLVAAKSHNLTVADIQVAAGSSVKLGKLKIGTDADTRMLTFYYKDRDGGLPAFQVDSFFDVKSGKIPYDKYRDKIVLIGPTSSSVGSVFVTPISPAMPAVLMQAHAVSSLLSEHFFVAPTWGFWVEKLVFLLIAGYLIGLLPRIKAGMAAGITAGLLVALVAIHFALMTTQLMWLQLMVPASLLLLGHLLLTTKRFLVSERGKEKSDADSAESNRMLGLAFQGQGQLDMAFDKFRKCPMDDALMENMYNLALDFERKRQFNKAEAAFRYIFDYNPKFRDIESRVNRAKQLSETVILGGGGGGRSNASLIDTAGNVEKPMLGRYEIEKELGKGAMGVVAGVRSRRTGRGQGALLPRGRNRGAPQPPQHRHHVRCRRGARPGVHRDGVSQGQGSGALLQAGQFDAAAARHEYRRAGRRCAVLRARKPCRASRCQAGEHHVRAGVRPGQGDRLRHCAHYRFVEDQNRHGAGYAELHVARATRGQEDRRPLRPVLAGCHALPDVLRQTAVRGRFDGATDVPHCQ
jgi:serine/threonine-protein kinase